MKSYVITIMDNPKSVKSAERCIASGPQFDIQMYEAFTPADDPIAYFEERDIDYSGFEQSNDRQYSYETAAMSAFISHSSLWERCVETNEEIQIFEHDAVITGTIPEFIAYKGCISLGYPSYGRYNTPPNLGVNRLTSKPYFPGAHAYRVNPNGAKILLEARQTVAQPTDVFLNAKNFPWLEEYFPWPVEAVDTFTTIQRELGCRAKHNYNEYYEITPFNED